MRDEALLVLPVEGSQLWRASVESIGLLLSPLVTVYREMFTVTLFSRIPLRGRIGHIKTGEMFVYSTYNSARRGTNENKFTAKCQVSVNIRLSEN